MFWRNVLHLSLGGQASLVQADAAVEGNVFVIKDSFRKFDQVELQRVGRANGI